MLKQKIYDVCFTDIKGQECHARYQCKNKAEAKRLFFTEIKTGETLISINKVKKLVRTMAK